MASFAWTPPLRVRIAAALERVKVECGHVAEVGHVLCQSLRCARDFEKHKNILMKL